MIGSRSNILIKLGLVIIICMQIIITNADDGVDQLTGAFNGAWNSVKDYGENFGTGIAATFSGKCIMAGGCSYSVMVWNDSPGPINAVIEDVKKVMGIDFDGDTIRAEVVQPYQYVGGVQNGLFWHMDLYFKVALQIDVNNPGLYESYSATKKPANPTNWNTIFRKNIAYPDMTNNVYYYRVYTDKTVPKAEYLGIKTTTNEFNGVFTNSAAQSAILKFMKNGQTYQATLEPGSFSLLSSDSLVKDSIRPAKEGTEKRFLTFLKDGSTVFASLPLMPEAICGMQPNPVKPKEFIPSEPMLYTYEVFQNGQNFDVGMQGLALGHYPQTLGADAKKNVVRDINPLECHVWYQSPDDYKKKMDPKDTDMPFEPNGQVWISYTTKDSLFQKKIKAGDVVDFSLLRPQISEKKSSLLVVFVATQDDVKAKAFLKRLTDGVIGQDALEPVVKVSTFDAATVLSAVKPNLKGIIDDTKGNGNSGVKGLVLLVDRFSPRGLGYGPYYYQIPPALLRIDQLSGLFATFLDAKKISSDKEKLQKFSDDLDKKIIAWIVAYQTNKSGITQEITQFIQQYGADGFFETKGGSKTLNALGKHGLDMLLSGPVSFENYPLIYQAGSNEFILLAGDKPKDWPAK